MLVYAGAKPTRFGIQGRSPKTINLNSQCYLDRFIEFCTHTDNSPSPLLASPEGSRFLRSLVLLVVENEENVISPL